jgi:hypothetical protein
MLLAVQDQEFGEGIQLPPTFVLHGEEYTILVSE